MRHCLADEGAQMDADRELDDIGRRQAKLMRKMLKLISVNPDVIIASPFKRTVETAEAVQRGSTPIVYDPALEPDSTPEKALKKIRDIADERKADSVLVVTHGPLIQKILAAVAFQFDTHFHWTHGACAYVNTHESQFRWFITPKMAAHLFDKDPKKYENPLGEAASRELYGGALVILSEHLLKVEKASVIDPLVADFRVALKRRWRKQRARALQAIAEHKELNVTTDWAILKGFVMQAIPGTDPAFLRMARRVRSNAYAHGAVYVQAKLVKPQEAKAPKKPANLPGADDGYLDRMEGEIDATSSDRVGNLIDKAAAEGIGLAALTRLVREEMDGWSDAPEDQVSRGETIGLGAVSDAYHQGGADYVDDWSDANGAVEKVWESEPDACEDCQANSDMGPIDAEAPFDTGDFEPPAHPNCRCSLSYQPAEES